MKVSIIRILQIILLISVLVQAGDNKNKRRPRGRPKLKESKPKIRKVDKDESNNAVVNENGGILSPEEEINPASSSASVIATVKPNDGNSVNPERESSESGTFFNRESVVLFLKAQFSVLASDIEISSLLDLLDQFMDDSEIIQYILETLNTKRTDEHFKRMIEIGVLGKIEALMTKKQCLFLYRIGLDIVHSLLQYNERQRELNPEIPQLEVNLSIAYSAISLFPTDIETAKSTLKVLKYGKNPRNAMFALSSLRLIDNAEVHAFGLDVLVSLALIDTTHMKVVLDLNGLQLATETIQRYQHDLVVQVSALRAIAAFTKNTLPAVDGIVLTYLASNAMQRFIHEAVYCHALRILANLAVHEQYRALIASSCIPFATASLDLFNQIETQRNAFSLFENLSVDPEVRPTLTMMGVIEFVLKQMEKFDDLPIHDASLKVLAHLHLQSTVPLEEAVLLAALNAIRKFNDPSIHFSALCLLVHDMKPKIMENLVEQGIIQLVTDVLKNSRDQKILNNGLGVLGRLSQHPSNGLKISEAGGMVIAFKAMKLFKDQLIYRNSLSLLGYLSKNPFSAAKAAELGAPSLAVEAMKSNPDNVMVHNNALALLNIMASIPEPFRNLVFATGAVDCAIDALKRFDFILLVAVCYSFLSKATIDPNSLAKIREFADSDEGKKILEQSLQKYSSNDNFVLSYLALKNRITQKVNE